MTDLLDPTLQGFLWIIAIGLTVIVVDVFFETEVLSIGALLGISIYFSLLFDVAAKWRVLIAILCWLLVTALFYTVWRRFLTPLIRRGFTGGIDEAIHSAVGSTCEYRLIDGKGFVYWNGDLWPIDGDGDQRFDDHDEVTVQAVEDGIFSIAQKGDAATPATSD